MFLRAMDYRFSVFWIYYNIVTNNGSVCFLKSYFKFEVLFSCCSGSAWRIWSLLDWTRRHTRSTFFETLESTICTWKLVPLTTFKIFLYSIFRRIFYDGRNSTLWWTHRRTGRTIFEPQLPTRIYLLTHMHQFKNQYSVIFWSILMLVVSSFANFFDYQLKF